MITSPDSLLRINRILLTTLGVWPDQSRMSKTFWLIFSIFFLITQGSLQVGGMLAASRVDTSIFLESIPPIVASVICLIKFINFWYNGDKMKELLDTMRGDWASLSDENELDILRRWSVDSRKNSILFAAAVYGSVLPFLLNPIVTAVIHFLPSVLQSTDRNSTMSKPLVFHVEYLIDINKYYFPVVIHSYFGTWVYVTVPVAVDAMFMVYVQHACATFDIIGYRLEHLVDKDEELHEFKPHIASDKPYQCIIRCIIQHSKALEYANLIESANSFAFLFLLLIHMAGISFSGFQAVMNLDHPDESFKYASFTMAQIVTLFFKSWPPQRLADGSASICDYTMKTSWYLTSRRSRQVLQLLIMRSLRPCQLTAGGFYNLNLENFTSVVKTSMSFFTVLSSTQ